VETKDYIIHEPGLQIDDVTDVKLRNLLNTDKFVELKDKHERRSYEQLIKYYESKKCYLTGEERSLIEKELQNIKEFLDFKVERYRRYKYHKTELLNDARNIANAYDLQLQKLRAEYKEQVNTYYEKEPTEKNLKLMHAIRNIIDHVKEDRDEWVRKVNNLERSIKECEEVTNRYYSDVNKIHKTIDDTIEKKKKAILEAKTAFKEKSRLKKINIKAERERSLLESKKEKFYKRREIPLEERLRQKHEKLRKLKEPKSYKM